MGNDEIPEQTDIIMKCPIANSQGFIVWAVTGFGSNSGINICVRAPSEISCKQPQPVQYQNRVTSDNSGGPGSEQYSIRISKVLYSESGRYYCTNTDKEFDTYNNVRVIREHYFINTLLYNSIIIEGYVMINCYFVEYLSKIF